MSVTVIVGLQWGDEGKGRIVDRESRNADLVARFNAGPNAGHTIVNAGHGKIVLHHLPAGIVHGNVDKCVITGGAVINPSILIAELEEVTKWGIPYDRRLVIDQRCFMIFPWHRALDNELERVKGSGKTGTTCQGVGPVYTDHCLYVGVPIGYLLDPPELLRAMKKNYAVYRAFLEGVGSTVLFDVEAVYREYLAYADLLGRYIGNTQKIMYDVWRKGGRILGESGQGFWLDKRWAPPEFRTASSNTAGAFVNYCGIPVFPDRVVGVYKGAYVTRVGSGPFPTKMTQEYREVAEQVRRDGNEFGATTGRNRDVGWLDLPMLGPAIRVNGCTELALNKLDIRPVGKFVPVCDFYILGTNKVTDPLDLSTREWYAVYPNYIGMLGWSDISGVNDWEKLPEEAQKFVELQERTLKVPIKFVSTGPETDQMILR